MRLIRFVVCLLGVMLLGACSLGTDIEEWKNGIIEKEKTVYTVTYNANGATGGAVPVDSAQYKEGQKVTILGNTGTLVRTGYTFADWNTASGGTGTNYAAGSTFTMGSGNVILYAKWNPIVPPTSITVAAAGSATTITKGGTLLFTATVLPSTASQTVTWSYTATPAGATGVSINTAGVLSVTAASTATAVVVKATSTVATTVSGSSDSIAVNAPDESVEVTSVTVAAASNATSIVKGNSLQFAVSVEPTDAIQDVTWTYTTTPAGATGVSIDADGLLSVAADSTATAVVVKATSMKTTTVSGVSASITVTNTAVYEIYLVISGKQGTDTVSATPESGIAGATITINYTIADIKSYDAIVLSGAATDRKETSGTGSFTYTIDPAHAAAEKITINAKFVHVDTDSLNGLWWSQDIITETTLAGSGTSGVLVLEYPNFWRLNAWGYAHKGTYVITGGEDAGAFIAASTRKKDNNTSWSWADTSDDAITATSWTLSQDGTSLTLNTTVWTDSNPVLPVSLVYTKTDWYAAENNGANNGPWETKIGDPALNAIIPPPPITGPYGWVSETEFILPPLIDTGASGIQQNIISATRDLFKPITTGLNAPAYWGADYRLLNICSSGMDMNTQITGTGLEQTSIGGDRALGYTNLPGEVFRKARYIVFELGPNFTSFAAAGKEFINQYYRSTPIGSSNDDTGWNFALVSAAGVLDESKGVKYDAANKRLIIDLSKGIINYNNFSDHAYNEDKTNPADTINTGSLKLTFGFRSGNPNFKTIWDVQNVYLVNIRDDEVAASFIGNFGLTAPANNAVDVVDDPTFTWGSANNAASYLLEVSKSSTFASGIISKTITGTSTKLDNPLEPGEIYYWRVTASATGLDSKVSTVRSFTTQTVAPDPFYKPSMSDLVTNNIINNTANVSLVDGNTGIRIASANTNFANLPIISNPSGTYNFKYMSLRYKLEDSGARLFLRQYEVPTPDTNSIGRFFLAWNGTAASGASIDLWNATPYNATAQQGEGLLFLPYTADTYSGNNQIYTSNNSVTGANGLKAFTFFGQNANSHITLYDITFYNDSELIYNAIHDGTANTATTPTTVLTTVMTAMASLAPGDYILMFYKGPGNSGNLDTQKNLYAVQRKEFTNSLSQQEMTDEYTALPANMGYMYAVYDANNKVHMAGTFRK